LLLRAEQEFLREHNADAAAAQQAAAAAADACGDGSAAGAAPSLWHQMQQRLQAEAAAVEAAERSIGPGLAQGGPDVFMFDGGLFAEEGEPSFALPNLSSANQQQQHGGKGNRRQHPGAKGSRADFSPEPLARLAASPKTPSFMDRAARLPSAAGKSPVTGRQAAAAAAAAGGGVKAAAAAALAAGGGKPPQQQAQAQAAALQPGGGAGAVQQQPQQRPDEGPQEQQQQSAGTSKAFKLLLSHSHSCSFSSLPKGLQQLLNSGDKAGSDGRRKKSRHKTTAQQQQQEGGSSVPHVESLVFGDIDGSVYRRLSSESRDGSRWQQQAAAAVDAAGGEVFRSCISDSEGQDSSSSGGSSSGSESESAGEEEGGSDSMSRGRSGAAGDDDAPEEGRSLRTQLLLGHLLLLASAGLGGWGGPAAAAGSGSTTSTSSALAAADAAGHSTSTSAPGPAAADSLQLLASHLRRAGLLPKWVHWLLRQLPQQPELYERAFHRLFQQVRCAVEGMLPASCRGVTCAVVWASQTFQA
jgi:hypothetical protein